MRSKRPPVTYVRWSTMWHLYDGKGETFCGRFIQPGADRVTTNPGIALICAVCREYLLTGVTDEMLALPYRLGIDWKPEPSWHEYLSPLDEWFEEWFVKQAVWLFQEGYSLETEWDVLGRFRIRAVGRGA